MIFFRILKQDETDEYKIQTDRFAGFDQLFYMIRLQLLQQTASVW